MNIRRARGAAGLLGALLVVGCGGSGSGVDGGDLRPAMDGLAESSVLVDAPDAMMAEAPGPALDADVDVQPAVDVAPDAAVEAPPPVDAAVDAPPPVDAAVDAPPPGDAAVDAPQPVDAAGAEGMCPIIVDAAAQSLPPVDAGTIDAAVAPTRTLVQVVQNAPWRTVQDAPGIAVDSRNRVFVADHDQIHMVEGSTVSLYLTTAEVQSAVVSNWGASYFEDFDVGPDDQLYILGWNGIVKSAAAHQATPWHQLNNPHLIPVRLAVIGTDDVVFIHRQGMSRASACGIQPVYTMAQLHGSSECATEDLAAGPSGVFLYEEGCNGSPLWRGRASGTGVQLAYSTRYEDPMGPLGATNFLCVARDPAGGFYVVVVNESNATGARLFHLTEDAAGVMGATHIPTNPTLRVAEMSQNQAFAFRYCSIAAARDGTVFLQTQSQLWKISRP